MSVASAETRVTERRKRVAAEATQAPAAATQPGISKAAERSLVVLCVIACGFVLWAAQSILVPFAVAVIVALCLTPVVRRMEAWGVPTPIAAILVVTAAAAGIAAGAMALAPGLAQWIERAPEIVNSVEAKTRSLQAWFQDFQAASSKLDELAHAPPDGNGPQQVTVVEPLAGGLLQSAPVVVGQTAFVIVLALFLIMVREPYRQRLILLPRTRINRLRVARTKPISK